MINELTKWQHPSDPPDLGKNDVHIWRANLNVSVAEMEKYACCLSEDELIRANKFRFPQHKRRFIVARSILRQLLARYLDFCPEQILFSYGDRGKPRLTQLDCYNCQDLQFNLSHSQETALYGFSRGCAIGVDLEFWRTMPDALKIARRFFSPKEFRLLASFPAEKQEQIFFKLWTAKEAYLKAIGTGLAGSLAAVEIGLDKSEKIKLEAIASESNSVENWSLSSCIPTSNCVAAIAILEGTEAKKLSFWDWND